jgi:hypothetical protein
MTVHRTSPQRKILRLLASAAHCKAAHFPEIAKP